MKHSAIFYSKVLMHRNEALQSNEHYRNYVIIGHKWIVEKIERENKSDMRMHAEK